MNNVVRIDNPRASPAEGAEVVDAAFQQARFGGGSGDGGGNLNISREEMDAKLERTEARVEKTLAELRADMAEFRERVSSDLSHVPSRSFLVGTAIGIVAVLLASVGIGVTMLGNGIMVATASVDRANQALSVAEKNAQQIQTLTDNLNKVLQQPAQPGSQDQ